MFIQDRNVCITIIVDGTPHEVPKKEKITHAEVVTLAYPDYCIITSAWCSIARNMASGPGS